MGHSGRRRTLKATMLRRQENVMKRRHKICLGIAVGLLLLGLLGLTEWGQNLLRGVAPVNETPFQADDRYMGAGLAPIIYCVVASILLFAYVSLSLLWMRLRLRSSSSNAKVRDGND